MKAGRHEKEGCSHKANDFKEAGHIECETQITFPTPRRLNWMRIGLRELIINYYMHYVV